MEDRTSQLLMRLQPKSSPGALEAECRLELGGSSSDPLAEGFAEGHYFEVTDFDLGLDLRGDEELEGKDYVRGQDGKWSKPITKLSNFARWREADGEQLMKIPPYPVAPDVLKFTRYMDKASPILFQYYANRLDFTSATLIKRLVVGSQSQLQTVLRIDLRDVALIDLSWSQDDVIRETCKLEYRKITLSFSVQADNGTLATAVSATWQTKAEAAAR